MSEIKFGVYINPKNGKLKTLEKLQSGNWALDEGKVVTIKAFGIRYGVFKEMSAGWPVYKLARDLKGWEYLGEL